MKLATRSIFAAALLGISSMAFADLTPADIARNVTFYDVNKDGMITRVEWMKMAAEKLDKMPAKGGMMDSRQAMLFLLELKKSDGGTAEPAMMSRDDVLKKAAAMFDKMDTKKAGMLDKKQFELFLKDLEKSAG
jgi:Ca2+-binding EF-hand superfamily protein